LGEKAKTEKSGSDGSKVEEETMWQGKPIESWSLEEKNIFFDKLKGREIEGLANYFGTAGFFSIQNFMERELPEVWEGYLGRHHEKMYYACLYNEDKPFTRGFNAQLDLSNLITFLLDNQEGWEWKECTACTGNGDISKNSIHWGVDKITCPECQGAGKVKHPALRRGRGR
jgi:hypothetical protein